MESPAICHNDRVGRHIRACADRYLKEMHILFPAEILDAEICKLRGLLQMLHEDQPDVMHDIFEFHVTSLVTHTAPQHHPRIRDAARTMLADIQRRPVRPDPLRSDIQLMPPVLAAA